MEVTIPESITTIGASAFSNCASLADVTIPESVTEIRGSAFARCTSLTDVTIPGSVTSLGNNPFSSCTSLERIDVDPDNPSYVSIDGILYNKDCSVLIGYPAGRKMKSVTIRDGVTEIGFDAFNGCAFLETVTVPESVKTVGEAAFYNSMSLKDIYFCGTNTQSDPISFGRYAIPGGVEIHYGQAAPVEVTPGDINSDGKINSKDVIALMKAIVAGTAKDNPAADFNGDGKVNSKDVIAIMKAIVAGTTSEPTTTTTDWIEIYKDFVLNEKFLDVSDFTFSDVNSNESSEKPDTGVLRFGLKDISGDGVPELFIDNAHAPVSMASSHTYAFTIKDGSVKYAGIVGARNSWINSAPDGRYPGVFCLIHGGGGGKTLYYYEIADGELKKENVLAYSAFTSNDPYEIRYTKDGVPLYFHKATDNLDLYECTIQVFAFDEDAWGDSTITAVPSFSLSEIRDKGWDAFIENAGLTPTT